MRFYQKVEQHINNKIPNRGIRKTFINQFLPTMKKLLLSFLLSGLAAGAAHAQNYAIVTSDVADMKLDRKALRAMKTDNAGQILKDFQEQPAARKGDMFELRTSKESSKTVPVWLKMRFNKIPTLISRDEVSLFQASKLSPDALLKTYDLVSLASGQSRAKMDFVPCDSTVLMRLRWADAEKPTEYHEITKGSTSLWLRRFVLGEMPQTQAEFMQNADSLAREIRLYYSNGARAFFDGGHFYFAECTDTAPKETELLALEYVPKKKINIRELLRKFDNGELSCSLSEILEQINGDGERDSSTSGNVEHPQFPGGEQACMEFLAANIKYPPSCIEQGIQGHVYCQFSVDIDGSITDINILYSADPELSVEAVRVIRSMPKWIPGKKDGKPVPVKFTLPVNFRFR